MLRVPHVHGRAVKEHPDLVFGEEHQPRTSCSTRPPPSSSLTSSRAAGSFAARVRKEAGPDADKQIERAYWIALSRPPNDEERKVSLDLVRRIRDAEATKAVSTAASSVAGKPAPGAASNAGVDDPAAMALEEFCHTLMNSAAFVYID